GPQPRPAEEGRRDAGAGRRGGGAGGWEPTPPACCDCAASQPRRLPCYFRPLLLPDRVVHAVALAVAAFGDGRLPELDAVEVRRRRVGVVGGAGPLLDLFHVGAGLGVGRRLAEGDRLL